MLMRTFSMYVFVCILLCPLLPSQLSSIFVVLCSFSCISCNTLSDLIGKKFGKTNAKQWQFTTQ